MCQTALAKTIKKCVVSDYFTPNIKAEVILDTLLTPYIHKLSPGIELIAKEMSIPKWKGSEEETIYGIHGPKIDYVLAGAGQKSVYLVELKTTLGSLDDGQAENYLKSCGQNVRFGEVLGNQLLSLLQKRAPEGFGLTKEFKKLKISPNGTWDDNSLIEAFQIILDKTDPDGSVRGINLSCAKQAQNLIRAMGWAQAMDRSQPNQMKVHTKYRSRKYLYTLGQLVDYLKKGEDRSLWERPLEIIYLTPEGKCPQGHFQSVDLSDFVSRLEDTPYTHMLKEIVREIL